MTGRSLMRRLLANARLLDRWRDPVIVPLAARPVLDAVAEMAAASGDAEEYRVDPDIEGHRSLAGWVAWRMDALGAEPEVEACLQVLVHAELVVLTAEGGLALNVPPRAARAGRGPALKAAAPPRAAAAGSPGEATPAVPRGYKDRGGRPRKGEDLRQRRLRLLQSLPAAAVRKPLEETSESSNGKLNNLPETGLETEVYAAETGFGGFEVSSTSFLAAAEENEYGLTGQQQPKQGQAGAGVETGVSVNSEPGVCEVSADPELKAAVLVVAVSEALGLTGDTREDRASLVQDWLALPGMTPDRILAIARDRRGRNQAKMNCGEAGPIRFLKFLEGAVRDAAGVGAGSLPPAGPSAPSPSLPPVAAASVPELPTGLKRPWMTSQGAMLLRVCLDRASPDAPDQALSMIERLRRQDARLPALLYQARPDLGGLIEPQRRAG